MENGGGYSDDGTATAIRVRRFHVWVLTLAAVLLLCLCVTRDAERLQAQATLTDRQILEAFYDATDGTNWTNNKDWKGAGSVCTWYGVECQNGEVISLELSDNNLSGSIPSSLGSLSSLERLELNENQLTGEIPPELGDLTNLLSLILWDNQLTGEIPPELGDLTNLFFLFLDYNQLTGSIPSSLGRLSSLRGLHLHRNQLTGSIPSWLGDLTNLTSLWLGGNSLTGRIPGNLANLTEMSQLSLGPNDLSGSIPSWLGDFTNLTYLELGGNNLSGSIPPELGNLSNLTTLYLAVNQLTGSIPSRLGETALEHLQLSNNNLTGSIPPELGDLKSLTDLRLHFNELTGSIPPELGNLSSLESLWLRSNNLSGSIPSSLGNLTNLTVLNLGNNDLSGSIPPELGNLSSLERLWLFNNYQLSGPIPPELGRLTALTALGLSGNNLSGPIPPELGNLSNLETLYLQNNQLTGDVPDLNNVPLLQLGLGNNDLNLSWETFSSGGNVNLEDKSSSMLRLLLYENGLMGQIPEWIGERHTELISLYLHDNMLTGQIPENFANLTKLEYLSLDGNSDDFINNLDVLTGFTSVTVSPTEASSPQGLSAWLGGARSNVRLTLPADADASRSSITLTSIQHPDLDYINMPPSDRYGEIVSEEKPLGLRVGVSLFDDQGGWLGSTLEEPTVVCFGVPKSYAGQEMVVLENDWEYDDDIWDELGSADPPQGFSPDASVCGETGFLYSTLFIPVVDKSAEVGAPWGGAEALISRIEPSVRSVTVSAGDVVRLSIDIYGLQDALDNDLGEGEVFMWDDGRANGWFKSDKRANEIIYTAPTTFGEHTVTVTSPEGACEGGDDAAERCSATFTITVRRPSSVPEARPAPENPEGKIPSVLVDAEGRQYEVFTPEEGGIFDGDEVRLSAGPGAVPNGEFVGLRAEVAGPASNVGMTHHRYTLVGDAYELMAVDAAQTVISSSYVLNEPLEVCVPLPPVARRDISDVAMVVKNADDTLTVLSTSKSIVPSGIEVCGNLSRLPATVSVGVDGSPAALPTPTPMPEEPAPPDTGGSAPSGTGLLIFVILGAALAIVGASLAKGFRKRRGSM